MHLGIKKTTLEFERWIGYGEEGHKELLAEISALFDEHTILPYNDYFLEAVNDFQVGILDRSVPGWRDQASTWGWHEVSQWDHDQLKVHETKLLILAIIRDKGPDHLRDTLLTFTPNAPQSAAAASISP